MTKNKNKKDPHKISLYWDTCVSIAVDMPLLVSIVANVSIGVDVVVKTDDEVYVFTYYFYSYFSTVPKKVELLKIATVM